MSDVGYSMSNCYFVKPNKRGAIAERCSVSVQGHKTSRIFSIGPPTVAINIQLPDGSEGLLEVTEEMARQIRDQIDNLIGKEHRSEVKLTVSTQTWAARAIQTAESSKG